MSACPNCGELGTLEQTITHGVRCYMCGAHCFCGCRCTINGRPRCDDDMPADGRVGVNESGCGG